VLEQEDGNAVVGSPRGKQHISLVKCSFHHKSSQNDQPTPNLGVNRRGDYIQTPNQTIELRDKVPRSGPTNLFDDSLALAHKALKSRLQSALKERFQQR
jgi:hypothetical protein